MIRSMTGFGSAEELWERWMIRAEARSENHARLRLSIRLPEIFRPKESELAKMVEARVARGHVHVGASCSPVDSAVDLLVDKEKLRNYVRVVKQAAAAEDVPVHAEVGTLMSLPGVMGSECLAGEVREALWRRVLGAAREAVDGMVGMREAEGENLACHIRQVCEDAQRRAKAVAAGIEKSLREYRSRLTERVNRLLEGTGVALDEDAIVREVTFLAERSDVSEELIRLSSHLGQALEALQSGDATVGKKLEFLAQEMLREANTMVSKLPSSEQAQQALEVKLDVNRLLEQVRNVE